MSSRRLRLLLLIFALVFFDACNRQAPRPSVERIAVLRFENLGPDPSSDWMGRAFAEIIATELNGAPGLYPIPGIRLHTLGAVMGVRPVGAPGISAERAAAVAAGATRIAYGQYSVRGGVLEARLTVEDSLTGKMTVLDAVSAPPADVLSVATSLARQISPHLATYGTSDPRVIEAHVEGLEGLEKPGVAANLEKALAADPNFGPVYLQLAQYKVQQKDVAGALELIHQALARGTAIPAAEQALLRLEDATLRNDSAERLEALAALTRADPYDPGAWHDLASLSMARHLYAQGADAYRRAVAIVPDDADLWNQYAYAAAYHGDASEALDAAQHYQRLQPASPNPLDTLGDVNLILGHLPEAENAYREATRKNPEFLAGLDFLKGAMAHLMTGDIPGADALAQNYIEGRAKAKDPLADYRKAQWAWISGRRQEAVRQLEQVAQAAQTAGAREIASHAYAELAVWTVMSGNREAAVQFAQKTAALATPSAVHAVLVWTFTQPPASPAEWQARVAKQFPAPAQQPVAAVCLADALLLAKQFDAARPLLQQIYDSGNPAADPGLPILLAWADLETGHVPEAAALLRSNQPLSEVGLSWSTPLYFPRVYNLRAVAAEKQGKTDEARENARLFRTLSGEQAR